MGLTLQRFRRGDDQRLFAGQSAEPVEVLRSEFRGQSEVKAERGEAASQLSFTIESGFKRPHLFERHTVGAACVQRQRKEPFLGLRALPGSEISDANRRVNDFLHQRRRRTRRASGESLWIALP